MPLALDRASHILVTGGAGFIGSHFVELLLKNKMRVTVLDALTYAGHRENLSACDADSNFEFIKGSIEDSELLALLFRKNQFQAVVHFAAESHVDNSISDPGRFLQTNVMGTFCLLEAARNYFQALGKNDLQSFRFIHVSTDEVFGALGPEGKFNEKTAYAPNSPYSASKAASDHLVRAWFHTYKLPTVITNCSNNYGPRQFPEKLIPRMILQALKNEKLPVYGKGENIRDWIHVEDHCEGVFLALTKGQPGEEYCFGGDSERKNIAVVKGICRLLQIMRPQDLKYESLIEFVQDRAGHDYRYAIDDSKARRELGFTRKYSDFESGLQKTVDWYLNNSSWIKAIESKSKKGNL